MESHCTCSFQSCQILFTLLKQRHFIHNEHQTHPPATVASAFEKNEVDQSKASFLRLFRALEFLWSAACRYHFYSEGNSFHVIVDVSRPGGWSTVIFSSLCLYT